LLQTKIVKTKLKTVEYDAKSFELIGIQSYSNLMKITAQSSNAKVPVKPIKQLNP
jgi:hypothetical protein